MQALKGVVIIMTLTIAVLMTLIVYGMYQKSQNPDFKFFEFGGSDQAVTEPQVGAEPMASTVPATSRLGNATRAFGDISLPLAANARIVSATVAGDRLVIVSSGPQGDQVWVVNMATGQVLGRVSAPGTP